MDTKTLILTAITFQVILQLEAGGQIIKKITIGEQSQGMSSGGYVDNGHSLGLENELEAGRQDTGNVITGDTVGQNNQIDVERCRTSGKQGELEDLLQGIGRVITGGTVSAEGGIGVEEPVTDGNSRRDSTSGRILGGGFRAGIGAELGIKTLGSGEQGDRGLGVGLGLGLGLGLDIAGSGFIGRSLNKSPGLGNPNPEKSQKI